MRLRNLTALSCWPSLLSLSSLLLASALSQPAAAYEKAVEGPDVVLDKLYPKKGKIELDFKAGYLLTSSYIQTFMVGGGLTYFWSENWGFNVEGLYALNSDKVERNCIENFYNDPHFAVSTPCGSSGSLSQDNLGDANMGPAYVPIREINYLITGNFIWNPVYGKQLILMSTTTYFDVFFGFGGGMAFTQYYPEQTNFANGDVAGHRQRGTTCLKADAAANKCDPTNPPNPGAAGTDTSEYGIPGRPLPLAENKVMTHLQVGQRFHFGKHFELIADLEDFTLVGNRARLR